MTRPGDRYTVVYNLPDAGRAHEVFLESRGYYLEWMRQEWLKEDNPFFAQQMFTDPQAMLRRIAPEFKRVEAQMDSIFWRSAYAR